jgi:hypothetical protein
MKNTAFILIFILSQLMVLSQPCLPEGITFTSQAQIDSFQINYPGCADIEGSVFILGDDITNLNGLSVLNSIGGDFEVQYQIYLINLAGLEGLSSVGGNFYIENTAALASISELESLTSIGGDIYIVNNNALTSLEGLEGLGSISGYLGISSNYALTSLSGLENVTSISGGLGIQSNDALTGLSGLENVTSIGGDLMIRFNDEFANLVDLGGITSIEGALVIESNDVLTSLTGLEGITSLGGDLYINNNPSLVNLKGLEGIKSIGEDLIIESNDALTSIMELEAVNSIEAYLNVRFNNSLTSLTGLDNIDASSIMHLYIDYNPLLSTCEVQSICDYLASPNGETSISGNAPGCTTIEEVDSICNHLIIQEQIIDDFCTVSPNPFANSTTLSFRLSKPENVQFTVYNVQSQIVFRMQERQDRGEQKIQWNAEGLPAGMYYFRIQAGETVGGGKIIKISDI